MSAELVQHLRALAADGVRIHLWPTATGFQANAAEPGGNSWTCHTAADPIDALMVVLRQRVTRTPDRVVGVPADPQQIDIEEAIGLAMAPNNFEDVLG